MLREPFNILREKVPFLEYGIRSLLLFLKPQIETQEQLKFGRMKYALWDISLSVSLVTTVVGVFNVYNQKVDLATVLTAFSSQFGLFVAFGYYAYFSTFSFFILAYICMFILKPADVHPFNGAYLASLHYARWYALFLFLFLPLLALYLNALFTELVTIDEFVNKAGSIAWLILGVFVGLYIQCCVIPIKKYWSPCKSKLWSYMLVLVITNLAFSANLLAPSLGALELNREKACELFMKSDKITALSKDEKNGFKLNCLSEIKT